MSTGDDPLADRRQRAREAGWDAYSRSDESVYAAMVEAVETATRVQIDDDIVETARANSADPDGGVDGPAVAAAFRAAGFEVEE